MIASDQQEVQAEIARQLRCGRCGRDGRGGREKKIRHYMICSRSTMAVMSPGRLTSVFIHSISA